jgi:hypothetical protein
VARLRPREVCLRSLAAVRPRVLKPSHRALIIGLRKFREPCRHSLIVGRLTLREVCLHSSAAGHLTVRAVILEEAMAMAQVGRDADRGRGNNILQVLTNIDSRL